MELHSVNDFKNNQDINESMLKIKANIKALIDNGMLDDAKKAIDEYEDIVTDDYDIYSMKGIIAILEERFDVAEEIFIGSLLKDSKNCDLLHNIAYLYKIIGKIDRYIFFTKKLYYLTENEDEKIEIEKEFEALGFSLKNKVLIGSPIYQKPEILDEFLLSLDELDKENIDVHYYFIDDNKDDKSSRILYNYADKNPNVYIQKSNSNDDYNCDKNTHHWKENLIWKVAAFKDAIIKYAKENFYDYLFFIDSDLVLDPNTLKHLISSGKDIISELFWTRWKTDNLVEMPQVWLKDQYDIFNFERGEVLTDFEKQRRANQFITSLRTPGLYEVGGLGACTLISKLAIDMGVSFKEIKNISFWGEDRHFCIRAAALGIPLFVDTNYPAYHIYRESDLAGVLDYKNSKRNKEILPKYYRQNKSNEITLSMVVKNEGSRYLEEMLMSVKDCISRAVIIDDASTDNTVDIIKKILNNIPLTIIQNQKSKFSNEIELRKQQWEETIKTNPCWILNLDADEVFESKFATEVQEIINQDKFDVISFRLFDFWNRDYYREDQYWNAHLLYRAFMIRYRSDFNYVWKETKQHCGRFPMNIIQLPMANSKLRIKHYGWANYEDRKRKYERYMLLDSNSLYGKKEQYDSIMDENPNLIKWEE